MLGGVYVQDQLTAFLNLLFIVIAALTILFAPDYLEPRGLPMGEFTATLLFAISGAMLLAGAQDLLILFVGLELLVLPGYMLAGFAKHDGLSTEGAIKYFLLGSFSSADPAVRARIRVRVHRHDPHRRRRPTEPHRGGRRRRRCPSGSPWASRSSSPAAPSRSRRCPSTTGHPTPTRAHRRP